MANEYAVYADARILPFCCGFLEAGHFRDFGIGYGPDEFPSYTFGKDQEAAWKKLFAKLRGFDEGKKYRRPIIFNFKKEKNYHEFDGEFLRQMVMKEPDYQFVAEYKNPNTGNTIFSCILLNGAYND